MATFTKTSLNANTTTELASGASIPISKHRGVNLNQNDNAYADVVTESYTNLADNTTNTTPNGTTHYYALYITKQGRNVSVAGTLTNKTGATATNEVWMTVNDGNYKQSSHIIPFYAVTPAGTLVKCQMINSDLKVIGSVSNNATLDIIPFTYYTQD